MLTRVIVFPLALLIACSAAYEVWLHAGFPVAAAQASPAPAVRIVSAPAAEPSFTYENKPFGFSITYPSTMVRSSSPSLGWSYGAEVKNGALLLSLSLPPQAPYARDGGIGVLRVGVASDPASVGNCTKATAEGISQGTVTIGGQPFQAFSYPSEGIESYRASRGGTCYALEVQVKPDAGTPPSSEASAAKDMLESILASFTFS